jgi:hypothetical protein
MQVNTLNTNEIRAISATNNTTINESQINGVTTFGNAGSRTGTINIGSTVNSSAFNINIGKTTTGTVELGTGRVITNPILTMNAFSFSNYSNLTSNNHVIQTGTNTIMVNIASFGSTTGTCTFPTPFQTGLVTGGIVITNKGNINTAGLIYGITSYTSTGFNYYIYNSTLSTVSSSAAYEYMAIGY